MTPIYKSPDESAAKAIQKLLADHNIETSIIETRNAGGSIGGAYIKWFELWLRKQSQAAQAKVIVTQFEFTSFRKPKATAIAAAAATAAHQAQLNNTELDTTQKTESANDNDLSIAPVDSAASNTASDYDEAFEINQETVDLIKELDIKVPTKRREELIPINNKRVFKRLGLLLGFSEEEIEEYDRNKLYRPWDSSSLMEKIAQLKQKCR